MSIIDNRKAFFDYFIEDRYEAGLVLEGWEVKAHPRRPHADQGRLCHDPRRRAVS